MKASICCTNPKCDKVGLTEKSHIVKFGFYGRRCDGKRVQRFRCKACGQTISNQTFNATYRHHRPRMNRPVLELLCSKVSMRQVARLLGINQKTVARKMSWHAEQARLRHQRYLSRLSGLTHVQMDEMETFEHTKCKPLSIALAVNPLNRRILSARVAIMPAKGKLANISRKKYGKRKDERAETFREVLNEIKPCCLEDLTIKTDMKPSYPHWIKGVLPKARHTTTKGRRGCVSGYGDMKIGGFDPLFCLNHTAAMIRDNLARLLRRTWCASKKASALQDALDLYVWVHNSRLHKKQTARQH
jgi:transposase-like protein